MEESAERGGPWSKFDDDRRVPTEVRLADSALQRLLARLVLHEHGEPEVAARDPVSQERVFATILDALFQPIDDVFFTRAWAWNVELVEHRPLAVWMDAVHRARSVHAEQLLLFGRSQEEPLLLVHGAEPQRRERSVDAVFVADLRRLREADGARPFVGELVVAEAVGELRRLDEARLQQSRDDVPGRIRTREEEPMQHRPDGDAMPRDV